MHHKHRAKTTDDNKNTTTRGGFAAYLASPSIEDRGMVSRA